MIYMLNNEVDLGNHRNPKVEIDLLEVGEHLLVANLQILVLVPDLSASLSKHSCEVQQHGRVARAGDSQIRRSEDASSNPC